MGYVVIIMLITFTSHKFSWYPIYVRSKWESRYILQSALMKKQIHNYWSAGKTEIFFQIERYYLLSHAQGQCLLSQAER